jgi:hypothetical protein
MPIAEKLAERCISQIQINRSVGVVVDEKTSEQPA